jgi:hypothetical protein
MENPVQILTPPAGVVSGLFDVFFAFVTGPASIPVAGGTVSPAVAGRLARPVIPGEAFAAGRRRHGTVDEQFGSLRPDERDTRLANEVSRPACRRRPGDFIRGRQPRRASLRQRYAGIVFILKSELFHAFDTVFPVMSMGFEHPAR